MKDTIYIMFNKNGIRSLFKKTKGMGSLPVGTYMAELNLEVDNKFFDNQIPKFDIKLDEGNIIKPEIKVEENNPTPLAMFFSEFDPSPLDEIFVEKHEEQFVEERGSEE